MEAATLTEHDPGSRTQPNKQNINAVWGCTPVTPGPLGRVKKATASLRAAWANGNFQVTLAYTRRSCLEQTKEMNEANKMAGWAKDLLPDLSEFDPQDAHDGRREPALSILL